jgi:S1/P1 Nuclease
MRTFRVVAASLTLLSAVGWADRAFAWGDLGHAIVCEIAFHELNDQARQEVRRLIRLDPEFTRFSQSCTWPDHPRKRASEHFINVPRDFDRFAADECVGTSQCLLTAISADLLVLQTSTDDQAQLAALKFLGHWVGDIHQPLHVSFEDDRGGGKVKESGPCSNSLHSVWDSCIIQRELGEQPTAVARDFAEDISDSERASWRASPVRDWANESFAVVRRETVGYCTQVGSKCVYELGNEQFDDGEAQKTVTVDATYLETHAPIVAERLKRAGVRPGHVLNQALGQ